MPHPLICQKCHKQGPRRVPMVDRGILTEPFESVAIDIVGPLPTRRGGNRCVLTCICLATRYPSAVPMHNGSRGPIHREIVQGSYVHTEH